MKAKSIIGLSFKNTVQNYKRSLKVILIIALVALVVITTGNFCYSYNLSVDNALLKMTTDEQIVIKYDQVLGSPNEFDYLSYFTELYNFAPISEYQMGGGKNSFIEEEEEIDIYAYLGEGNAGNNKVEMVEGEKWTIADMGKPYIYLSEKLSEKKSVSIGDKVKFKFKYRDEEYQFEVKGIVKGEECYADYTYFGSWSLYVTYEKLQSPNMQKLYELVSIYDRYNVGNSVHVIYSPLIDAMKFQDITRKIVILAGVFLMLLATCLCLFSIINILKLSTMENGRFIGILTALGAKRKEIRSYIFCCAFYPMLIALVIATAFASFLGPLFFGAPTQALLEFFFERQGVQSVFVYTWFMPFICLVAMTLVVGLTTLSLTSRKKLSKITEMISEVE